MKTREAKITLTIKWTITDTMIRSNVIGGFQAEIHNDKLVIYSRNGGKVSESASTGGIRAMKSAEALIACFLGGD